MKVVQLCVTLCDPMDYGLPGYYVHGSFQARVLQWVAISFSRGIFPTRESNPDLPHCSRCFNLWATREDLLWFISEWKRLFLLNFNSFTEGRLNTDHSFCLFFLLFFYLAFPPIIIFFIFWLFIHNFSVLLSLLN